MGSARSPATPPGVRRDLFEPAMCDLQIEQARGIRKRVPGPPRSCSSLIRRLAPAEVLEMFFHDVRHAFRLLRREPGFTLAAVLTLTLEESGRT